MITLKTKSKTLSFNIMIIKISQLQNIGEQSLFAMYETEINMICKENPNNITNIRDKR